MAGLEWQDRRLRFVNRGEIIIDNQTYQVSYDDVTNDISNSSYWYQLSGSGGGSFSSRSHYYYPPLTFDNPYYYSPIAFDEYHNYINTGIIVPDIEPEVPEEGLDITLLFTEKEEFEDGSDSQTEGAESEGESRSGTQAQSPGS